MAVPDRQDRVNLTKPEEGTVGSGPRTAIYPPIGGANSMISVSKGASVSRGV